jgi:hypothetical protein
VSPRTARRLLWLSLVCLLPLPMVVFGAWIPVTRYLLLAGVTAGLVVTEGAGLVPLVFLALFLAHALVYAALAWLAARLLVAALARRLPRALAPLTLGLVAAGLALALLFPIYETPFAPVSPRANLLHVLE